MVSSLVMLALAAAASALSVTSPTKSDVWTVGEDQTVTWDTVSTDADTFSIYLSNMAEYPSVSTLLLEDVSSSDGSATIDGSKLTSGNSFTINFVKGTTTEQIYAQSVSSEHHTPSFQSKRRKLWDEAPGKSLTGATEWMLTGFLFFPK